MTPVVSTSFAKSKVLLSTPGKFFNVACTIAAAGTYYLILLDAAAAPADATDVTVNTAVSRYIGCLPVTTTAVNEARNLDAAIDGFATDSGITCLYGCTVLLSSTVPTNVTGVASGLWCNGSVG